MSFAGFSEEDLKRIKSSEVVPNTELQKKKLFIKRNVLVNNTEFNKQLINKEAFFNKESSDDAMDSAFDKCKLSIKSPTDIKTLNNENLLSENINKLINTNEASMINANNFKDNESIMNMRENSKEDNGTDNNLNVSNRKNSASVTPDVVRCVDNYTEDDLANHRLKLAELQLQQKLMEEQNKKRKEMLAKALADRTKQTEEEVLKLEKIKKELQILDSQFSQDVSVLRKKIDQACFSYADAEKHYLKIEKEFLQAKIHLQKEKEKKELLTEHLCALITHNETRKAQKLETLMLELANDRNKTHKMPPSVNEDPVIIDGVDQRTGKMVEFVPES